MADNGCKGMCSVTPNELAMLPFDPAATRTASACSQFDARANGMVRYAAAYVTLAVVGGVATIRNVTNTGNVALGTMENYPLTGYGWSPPGIPNAQTDDVPSLIVGGNPVPATIADTDATGLGRYADQQRMIVVHGIGAKIGQLIEGTAGTTVALSADDQLALERFALERFGLAYQAADSLFQEILGRLSDFSAMANDSAVPGGRGHPARLRSQLWLRGTTPGIQQTDSIAVVVAGGGFTFANPALVPDDDYYLPVVAQLFSTLAPAVPIAG